MPDLVLTDINFSGAYRSYDDYEEQGRSVDHKVVLQALKDYNLNIPVIVWSGNYNVKYMKFEYPNATPFIKSIQVTQEFFELLNSKLAPQTPQRTP